MKPEIKKLLILNLPYLLFVWLFDKAGAAVRLSPGADASAKLLHLGDGFTTAFSSIAPSFHPADLALGIAGAVIVRLIIYTKGKNAKKYRRGTEYGSARWGGADDIKPYTDPVFENNIAINEGMSELQTLKTAIHEIAHAKLHDIDLNAPKDEQQPHVDRRTREVEALYPCFYNVDLLNYFP